MSTESTVFVVDDDASMRESLCFLLQSVGLPCRTFSTAEEFLASYEASEPGCVVLDLRMPGMGGLALQDELNQRGVTIPIIFITAYGEVSTAVRALKRGAVEFLEKPFDDQTLVDQVKEALTLDLQQREADGRRARAVALLERLSPRQQQVMDLIVEGKSNKVIADVLNIREKTVEVHRAQLMRKLKVSTVAALLQLAHDAQLPTGKPLAAYRKSPN
ncbi:MAG: response regulator transcription factor [Deltaproteobacteria bacterium]|nr:response regulator transcription factor [Deltaproteobacteria bacterium]